MRALYYSDRDLCGQRFSLQPAPPFHGMGFIVRGALLSRRLRA
jgi:hypothetical protein